MEIGPDSPLAGRSIGEMEIRKKTGVSVVGVIRGDRLTPNPAADFSFLPGDIVAVIGKEEQQKIFQDNLLTGIF